MKDISNPIKELIEKRINNLFGEESADLEYVHLFFPKLITLIGTKGCMMIYEGNDPVKVFEEVGLTKEDYEAILAVIREGMRVSSFDDSLETLREIDKRSDILIKGYLDKVRNFKIKRGASPLEINKFDEDIRTFFGNDPVIFTPCSEYEKSIDNKNNVK